MLIVQKKIDEFLQIYHLDRINENKHSFFMKTTASEWFALVCQLTTEIDKRQLSKLNSL